MPITYTPNKADALGLSFEGVPFDDPQNYSTPNNKRVDAKFFLKAVQDEILALWASKLEGAPGLKVENVSGFPIVKGSLVCISGYSTYPTIALAIAGDFRYPPSYVVTEDIADGDTGNVFSFATVTGLDTSAYSVGDELYLSYTTPGTFSADINVSYKVRPVGRVVTVDASTGTIFFFTGLHLDQSVTVFGLQAINNTGFAIPAGPVALGPWIESSLAFRITPAVGVRADFISGGLANGATGPVYPTKSFISSIDTTGAAVGDPVYLVNDGTISLSPTSQIIGYVKTLDNPGAIKGCIKPPVPYRGESTGAPASPLPGDTYYEIGDGKVYIYANSGWIALT